ncbi:MAG TPA: hypothetical protein DCM86_16915 [Verrucomicrobiales bacterium]|nr:hypothetical protein [Verrucomicrobiales bacterium]
MPELRGFEVGAEEVSLDLSGERWLPARGVGEEETGWWFGARLVLQTGAGFDLQPILELWSLEVVNWVDAGLVVAEAGSPQHAVRAASSLADWPGVRASYPVFRRQASTRFAYSPAPNDDFFPSTVSNVQGEWFLENRDPVTGGYLGPDLNVRGAWAYSRGAGVTIAFADTGIELAHPDLKDRVAGQAHRNFATGTPNGNPVSRFGGTAAHGTSCAGLAAATADNHLAMAGVAPSSGVASWVIFDTKGVLAADDKLLEMFTTSIDSVAVQNHSWEIPGKGLAGPSPLQQAALEKAYSQGRGGRGVVMVRAGGNSRADGGNGNDDSYVSDPRAICVAAVRRDGRATDYSAPGACVLVSAPGGTPEEGGLFTTDLIGFDGVNFVGFLPPYQYLSDYRFNALGFVGTSASAPLVSGVVALMLSANPELHVRDVQQILALAARHYDSGLDPDVRRNGVGLLVSHNTGFGIVDAAEAVRLSLRWANRPPALSVTSSIPMATLAIPDNGLKLEITGDSIPAGLGTIDVLPGTGPFADAPTGELPLVRLGASISGDHPDLTHAAALIEWEPSRVVQEIEYAASLGAEFVVVYNCSTDGTTPCGLKKGLPLAGSDFTRIPSVFINRGAGLGLIDLLAAGHPVRARLTLAAATLPLDVGASLSLEHVSVRLRTDHPLRGDLRITLLSPSGTRSVLQRLNDDVAPGPVDWTYTSVQHLLEPSAGRWTIAVSDGAAGAIGSVLEASLILTGVPIEDADRDGLDDGWERRFLGGLDHGPREDLVGDGYSLVRKFVAGWDPTVPASPQALEITPWSPGVVRVSWPWSGGVQELLSGADPGNLLDPVPVETGPHEGALFLPSTNGYRFLGLRAVQ